ncbi:hypothetical protein VPHD528_0227 [Vibrio phage D528]|nr:hypothetical protein MYOV002v2_p0207 [Vibrio phage 144E46.1]
MSDNTAKNITWAVPVIAVILSVGTSIATSSFRDGNDAARVDSLEKTVNEISASNAQSNNAYASLTNQLTELGGKLDLMVNDISYMRRDYNDMKSTTDTLTSDMSELKLYVLTQGKQGNLNGR